MLNGTAPSVNNKNFSKSASRSEDHVRSHALTHHYWHGINLPLHLYHATVLSQLSNPSLWDTYADARAEPRVLWALCIAVVPAISWRINITTRTKNIPLHVSSSIHPHPTIDNSPHPFRTTHCTHDVPFFSFPDGLSRRFISPVHLWSITAGCIVLDVMLCSSVNKEIKKYVE